MTTATATPTAATTPITPVLPVLISTTAQREYAIATGRQISSPRHLYEIGDLTTLDRDTRARVLDIVHRCHIASHDDPALDPLDTDEKRVGTIGYEWLHKDYDGRWSLYASDSPPGEEPASTDLDAAYLTCGQKTVSVEDYLHATYEDREFLDAMLSFAPPVHRVAEDTALPLLTDVLDAYDKSFEVVETITDMVARAAVAKRGMSMYTISDDLIEVRAPSDTHARRLSPIGLLRATDPEAFEAAFEACKDIPGLDWDERDSARSACNAYQGGRSWMKTDRQVSEYCVLTTARNVIEEHRRHAQQQKHDEDYKTARREWIEQFGSGRLKRAAQRGYKHDGLYVDERLAKELPGFISAIGKSKIGEVINPTAEALELEEQTLRLRGADGMWARDDDSVQLVWVRADPNLDLPDGEYVKVSGYLGRHAVFRPVNDDTEFSA